MLGHQLIQEQEQYPPFFKAIQDAYASNVGEDAEKGINETHSFLTTIEEDYSMLQIIAKPEVEAITFNEAFGIKPKHLAD
jgi:hypothetical protein